MRKLACIFIFGVLTNKAIFMNSKVSDFCFAIFFLVISLVAVVPFSPTMPGMGLDASWELGVNQAVAQGLIFGKDIAFTLGPYASLYSGAYHPATDGRMLGFGLYFGFLFFLSVWMNVRRMPFAARCAFSVALVAMVYSRDALFFVYPALVVFYVYGEIHRSEAKDTTLRYWWVEGVIVILLLTPFGLLPLIKGSMWLACLVALVVLVFFYGRRKKMAAAMMSFIVPMLALGIFWLLADQPLWTLFDYFKWMLPIVSYFAEGMSAVGKSDEIATYISVALVMVFVIFKGAPGVFGDRAVLALFVAGLLFLTFKAGFVRHDTHALVTGTTLVLMAVAAASLVAPCKSWLLFCLTFMFWWQIDINYLRIFPNNSVKIFSSHYMKIWDGFRERIVDPPALLRNFNTRMAELREKSSFPLLDGSTDVYSHDQISLVASGNSWHPRPIFQSYSVYSKSLAELNRDHLAGAGGPQHVIFRVEPIDGRLPSLEDGASWSVLLSNYEIRYASVDYVHLIRKPFGVKLDETVHADASGVYPLGGWVDIPTSGDLFFAKIKIKKSFRGDLINFLFRPSQLEVGVILTDGSMMTKRFIAPMAEAGFLLSPWVDSNENFSWLFDPRRRVQLQKVKSIRITPVSQAWQWVSNFEMEISVANRRCCENSFESKDPGSVDAVIPLSPSDASQNR